MMSANVSFQPLPCIVSQQQWSCMHACGCRRGAFFGDSCVWDAEACRAVWKTFAFLHNQQSAGGCFHTTWSLAVQMRFYLLFPLALLLLRPKAPGFGCRPASGETLCQETKHLCQLNTMCSGDGHRNRRRPLVHNLGVLQT